MWGFAHAHALAFSDLLGPWLRGDPDGTGDRTSAQGTDEDRARPGDRDRAGHPAADPRGPRDRGMTS